MTGLFIVFEGGEGAGKSTQESFLAAWLEGKGERVVPPVSRRYTGRRGDSRRASRERLRRAQR